MIREIILICLITATWAELDILDGKNENNNQ
jgi:hypothetical protein